jgi:thymidylate synthase
MTKADRYMYDMINRIQCEGYYDTNPRPKYADGTPAHTLSVNHTFRSYDLAKGEFPICTLRPQAWKTGIREIFTIYQKPTNDIATMHDMGVTWWDEWDIGDGTIGQRYGATVSRYDLINNLIKDIQNDPYGRRKIVSLWQEKDLHETPGLAPCAFLTIWNVRGEYLDMMLVQRSGDMLTASGPGGINEIQYASLLMMIARHCGYTPGIFSHVVANEQIYDRHMDAAEEMKTRYSKRDTEERHVWDDGYQGNNNEWMFQRPKLILNPEVKDFYQMTIDDFELVDYYPVKPQLKLELGI